MMKINTQISIASAFMTFIYEFFHPVFLRFFINKKNHDDNNSCTNKNNNKIISYLFYPHFY